MTDILNLKERHHDNSDLWSQKGYIYNMSMRVHPLCHGIQNVQKYMRRCELYLMTFGPLIYFGMVLSSPVAMHVIVFSQAIFFKSDHQLINMLQAFA